MRARADSRGTPLAMASGSMRETRLCVVIAMCLGCGSDDGGQPLVDATPPDAEGSDYCAEAPADFEAPAPSTFYNAAFPAFVVTYPPENPYSWEKAILGKI